ncbi:MAG: M14 family zinc carboxypeptidase [Bdellovibrionota bacterium]
MFLLVFGISDIAKAQIVASETFANFAFAPLSFVSKNNISQYKIAQNEKDRAIEVYCTRLKNKFGDYKWSEDPCGGVHWDAKLASNNGHPLVYKVFGKGDNTTLFLGGVHPDELTPVHLAFKLARYLQENPSVYTDKNIRVVIAPLVNPDGFIRNLPSRTNANGVDVNRNFLTYDWYHKAISTWRKSDWARLGISLVLSKYGN